MSNIAKAEERLLARIIASNLNEMLAQTPYRHDDKQFKCVKNLISELLEYGHSK